MQFELVSPNLIQLLKLSENPRIPSVFGTNSKPLCTYICHLALCITKFKCKYVLNNVKTFWKVFINVHSRLRNRCRTGNKLSGIFVSFPAESRSSFQKRKFKKSLKLINVGPMFIPNFYKLF